MVVVALCLKLGPSAMQVQYDGVHRVYIAKERDEREIARKHFFNPYDPATPLRSTIAVLFFKTDCHNV
jgi:hypothetical protein